MLRKPQDLFRISEGETVSKRNLFDLVQFSKVPESDQWGGEKYSIGNTPQQGINWIGAPPDTLGVIIKTRDGSYAHDGWVGESRDMYRYSFKARKSVISYHEIANSVLISQPQHLYPVFLFTEKASEWVFEGRFAVSEIEELWVVLKRESLSSQPMTTPDEQIFREGGRSYVTHLMVERSRSLINFLKTNSVSVCDICREDFEVRYGVKYIEAHHKVPISTLSSEHVVKPEDLALLCPNCHKAVHIIMKKSEFAYDAIKKELVRRMS